MTDSDFEAAGRAFTAALQTEFEQRISEIGNMPAAVTVIHVLLSERAKLFAYIQKLEADNAALHAAYVDRTQKALAAGLVRWVVTGDRP